MGYENAIAKRKEQVKKYKKLIKMLDDKKEIAKYRKSMEVRKKEIKELEKKLNDTKKDDVDILLEEVR